MKDVLLTSSVLIGALLILRLLFRRVIPLRMPLAFLGTMAFLTYVFSKGNQGPLLWMAYELVSGGAVLAAFFLITDYTTSPVTPLGQVLYGIGCGALTVLLRYHGGAPEGVWYAVLIMNALVFLADRILHLDAKPWWRSAPTRSRSAQAAPAEASAPAHRSTGKRPAKAVGRNKK